MLLLPAPVLIVVVNTVPRTYTLLLLLPPLVFVFRVKFSAGVMVPTGLLYWSWSPAPTRAATSDPDWTDSLARTIVSLWPVPKTLTALLPTLPTKKTGVFSTVDPFWTLAYRLSVLFPSPLSMVVVALVLCTLKVSLSLLP